MKKYFLAIASFAFLYTGFAQDKSEKEPYAVQHFANGKINRIKVETTGGNISVKGSNNTEARVEVYVNGNNGRLTGLSHEQIRQKIEEDYELVISLSANLLTATAKPKHKFNWNQTVSISFKLFVPQSVSSALATSGGNISLDNLTGSQDFKTSGGNLLLDNLSGNILGKTSGGNIVISHARDNIDLATSGGNIKAENCSGKLSLRTSGGNLLLTELTGDIQARTSGGNVTGNSISGDLSTQTSGGSIRLKDITAGVDATTSAGNIDISFSSVTKKINLHNSSGNINIEIPANAALDLRLTADHIRADDLAHFRGEKDKEKIEGALNGGGTELRADAGSGSIRLSIK